MVALEEPTERVAKQKQAMSWRRKKEMREEEKLPPKPAPPPWELSRSIWAPRAKYADSRCLWDTDEVELRRWESDWSHCLRLGVAKTILNPPCAILDFSVTHITSDLNPNIV